MSNQTKGFIVAVVGVVLIFVIVSVSITTYYTTIGKSAIESGMEQGTVRGKPGVYWIYPETQKQLATDE